VQRAEWDFVLEIVFRTRFKKQMPFDYAQGRALGTEGTRSDNLEGAVVGNRRVNKKVRQLQARPSETF